MKKSFIFFAVIGVTLMMQSCYSSTVCVGEMKPETPAVKVNTIHNPHFIYGLVGSKDIKGKDYVAGQEDYKVKHYRSFVDMLLSSLTGGIYTPTTTNVYLPIESTRKK